MAHFTDKLRSVAYPRAGWRRPDSAKKPKPSFQHSQHVVHEGSASASPTGSTDALLSTAPPTSDHMNTEYSISSSHACNFATAAGVMIHSDPSATWPMASSKCVRPLSVAYKTESEQRELMRVLTELAASRRNACAMSVPVPTVGQAPSATQPASQRENLHATSQEHACESCDGDSLSTADGAATLPHAPCRDQQEVIRQ